MPLSVLIWLPAVCGVLGALSSLVGERRRTTPTEADDAGVPTSGTDTSLRFRGGVPGGLALFGSTAALALAIGYIVDFKPGAIGLQHVTDVVWIAELGIHYKLGIDGLNVMLIGLTTLLFAMAVLASNLR